MIKYIIFVLGLLVYICQICYAEERENVKLPESKPTVEELDALYQAEVRKNAELIDATKQGDVSEVLRLLNQGVDINGKDKAAVVDIKSHSRTAVIMADLLGNIFHIYILYNNL